MLMESLEWLVERGGMISSVLHMYDAMTGERLHELQTGTSGGAPARRWTVVKCYRGAVSLGLFTNKESSIQNVCRVLLTKHKKANMTCVCLSLSHGLGEMQLLCPPTCFYRGGETEYKNMESLVCHPCNDPTDWAESGFKCFMTTGKVFHSVQNDKELVHHPTRYGARVRTLVWGEILNVKHSTAKSLNN